VGHDGQVNEGAALRDALRHLLAAGERIVEASGSKTLRPAAVDLADQLSRRPEFGAVDSAADRAALANDYGVRTPAAPRGRKRTAGRALTASALVATGVAGWLAAGPDKRTATTDAVVEALAAYLSGPGLPSWRYLGIDADIRRPFAPQLIADWELVVPDANFLRTLTGTVALRVHHRCEA
jgi:hypothetical protein